MPESGEFRDPDVPSRFHVDFQGRTLLGTYRVDRRLAEGGMGAVYLAQDLNLGRRVVVKVPHVRFLAEPGFRARFRREVAELVRLEHPGIARILAQGEEDEIPFFVLQYLGGGSLEDRLTRGPMTPETVVPWLTRVAETLDYVHGQGIVHRDVKPGNILFDEQGHVFLSDFGVVKALEPAGGAELTEAGTGVGSPTYMAPEQAMARPVGPGADQYALASTVYEALTGEPPFGRGGALEVILRKARESAPSARAKLPSLPDACEQALSKALAQDPVQRFPWCVAFAGAFQAGITSAATQRVTLPPTAGRGLVPVFAVVALAVAGGVAALGLASRDPSKPSPAPVVDESPGVLLRLADAGAEPRAILRLTPATGTEDRLSIVLLQSIERQVDSEPPDAKTLRMSQEVGIAVENSGPQGATLRWSIAVPRLQAEGGADASTEQSAFESLGRGVGTSLLSPRGVASGFALTYASTTPGAEQARIALEEMVRMLGVPLPSEPVGVGAEWDATQLLEVSGVRYQQTQTWRVVARDGERVSLAGECRFASPPQRMAAPKGDDVKDIALAGIAGEGTMTAVLDAGRPAPVSMTTKGELSFTASGVSRGKTHSIRFRKSYESVVSRK